MHILAHLYIYKCVRVFVHVCVCVRDLIFMHVFCVCVCIYSCVCACTCAFTFKHISVCLYERVQMYELVDVCIRTCLCMYVPVMITIDSNEVFQDYRTQEV